MNPLFVNKEEVMYMKNILIALSASLFGWGIASLINREVSKNLENKKLAPAEPKQELEPVDELSEAAQQVIDAANNLIKFTVKKEEDPKVPQFTNIN